MENEIEKIFIAESTEILEKLENNLVNLELEVDNDDLINEIFRYIHTIKGSSGIVGYKDVYEFTHKLENLFESVRSNKLQVDKNLIDLMLDSLDWIKLNIFSNDIDKNKLDKLENDLTERILKFDENNYKIEESKNEQILEKVDKVLDKKESYYRVVVTFKSNIFEFGIDPLSLIEDLYLVGELISRTVLKDNLPTFENYDPEKSYLGWDIILKTNSGIEEIENVFLFVLDENIKITDVTDHYFTSFKSEDSPNKKIGQILIEKEILSTSDLESILDYQKESLAKVGEIAVERGFTTKNVVDELLIEQKKIVSKSLENTIRVETDRLDKLLNLLDEIVIGQSSLTRFVEELDDNNADKFKIAMYGLENSTREFQNQIMKIRMIPIGPTFEQFKRFVRDSAKENNKEINLIIEGAETELDKTVIEKIGDPLRHMIRNSIDHGIETSEKRVLNGKNKIGTIKLRSYHQGGNVYIEIIDDGGGINYDKIREKAIKKGFIREGDQISNEKLNLILFEPGFSTADQVGELSGRGVGMDVVKSNIESIRGTIQIKSQDGIGSEIKLKLPLTLAIIDGMLVTIDTNIFVLPLLSVIESIQPKKESISTIEAKGELILVRDEYIPIVRLYEHFNINPKNKNLYEGLVVIVESDGKKVAIFIDDLIGQQQIVIKSIERDISNSKSVSGATILGDGKVALIIDVHGLIQDLDYAELKTR